MGRVVDVANMPHRSGSQQGGEHTDGRCQPAQAQLQTTQLDALVLAQRIAQQDAHDVDRRAVRGERVHVVRGTEQTLNADVGRERNGQREREINIYRA